MTLKRPPALMVATLESPTCHLPILVTSLVVPSLRAAVPVSCEVSPTAVNVRLPLIETLVTVAEGFGVGAVGVGFSPPQFIHVGVRRVSSRTPTLLLEHRIVLSPVRGEDGLGVRPMRNLHKARRRKLRRYSV
ncbi:MAG TPA: hypothetical protein VFI87_06750 [Hyphomicrobiaceae bacterium]|nr:hypothetical protein [Hyphomicrobiaceae bacterium]